MGHPGAGSVKFNASSYIVGDNVSTATVSVVRSGGDMLPLMVEYATSNKTAQAGSDYTAVSGTLSFGTGGQEPGVYDSHHFRLRFQRTEKCDAPAEETGQSQRM